MSAAFAQAAASYFGLSADVIGKADVFTVEGRMAVAFECVLSDADVLAIADRMRQMQADQPVVKELAPAVPSYEEMVRDPVMYARRPGMELAVLARMNELAAFGRDFDNMSSDQKARWGSRHAYVLNRARWADDVHGTVTSNADDFGGMPG